MRPGRIRNTILIMENAILPSKAASSITRRSVDRALEGRRAAYAEEVHRLLQASFALIRERGELEPRVGEIVRRAGLSNQAFYRHFRSKDELLLAVLDEGVRMLESYLRHRMERVDAPEHQVRAWIAGVLEQALDPEAAQATRPFVLSRARLAELFPDEVEASERRLTDLLREAIGAAAAAGVLCNADAKRDAETLYDLAMGWVQRSLASSGEVSRANAEALQEFALHGLRRGAPPDLDRE